jgi:hypothetical protein
MLPDTSRACFQKIFVCEAARVCPCDLGSSSWCSTRTQDSTLGKEKLRTRYRQEDVGPKGRGAAASPSTALQTAAVFGQPSLQPPSPSPNPCSLWVASQHDRRSSHQPQVSRLQEEQGHACACLALELLVSCKQPRWCLRYPAASPVLLRDAASCGFSHYVSDTASRVATYPAYLSV